VGPAAEPALEALIDFAKENPNEALDPRPRRFRLLQDPEIFPWPDFKFVPPMEAVVCIGPAIVPRLIVELNDPSSPIHRLVLEALAAIGPPASGAVDIVLALGFDAAGNKRNWYFKALTALCDMQMAGIERLLALAADPKSDLQFRAIIALEDLSSHTRLTLSAVHPLREMADNAEHTAEIRAVMRRVADQIEFINRTK
jgi:hypothetical protein